MRERSHWGWGYEGKLPDEDARRALGMQVAAALGGEPLVPRPLPRIEDVTLRAPRISPPVDMSTTAHADRVRHTYGKSYRDIMRALRGDFATAPDAVAYPASEADVASLLAWCASENVA